MSEALAVRDPERAIQEEIKASVLVDLPKHIDRVKRIADGKDDKTALSAITLLLKLGGALKPPRPVSITFETLINKAVSASPLNGITQITESSVIDADDSDTDE